MREILFRAKAKHNNEWVYGDLSQHKTGKKFIKCGSATQSYEVIPETVGQYTGLKDKNGKKIFEGDIVKQHYSKVINERYDPETLGFIDSESIEGHHIGVVSISAQKGVGMNKPISFDDIQGTQKRVNYFVNISCYRCEVIGNIHDNPELLEEEIGCDPDYFTEGEDEE